MSETNRPICKSCGACACDECWKDGKCQCCEGKERENREEKQFEFKITLTGCGVTREEAWLIAVENFTLDPGDYEEKPCHYCGGNCPNESIDSENLCDGFQGDLDHIY